MNLLECLLKMLQDGKMKEIEDLKSLEKIYEVSRREGYEGTYEEFEKECEELIMNASHEISEKSLEKVSGGKMSKNLSKSTAAILSALTLSSVVTPSSSAASKYSFQNIKKNNSVVNFVKNNPGKVLATTAATLASLGLGVVFIAGVAHFVKKGSGAFDSCKDLNDVLNKLKNPRDMIMVIGDNEVEFINNLNSLINCFVKDIDEVKAKRGIYTVSIDSILSKYILEAKNRLLYKFPADEVVSFLRNRIESTNLKCVSNMSEFANRLECFLKGTNIENDVSNVFAQPYIDEKLVHHKSISLNDSNAFGIEVKDCYTIDEYISVMDGLIRSQIAFSIKGDEDKKERYFTKGNLYYRAGDIGITVIVEGGVKNVTSLELGGLNISSDWKKEIKDNKTTYTKPGVGFSIVEENGKYSISRDFEEIIPTNSSDESTEEADDVASNDSTGPNGETGTTLENQESNSNPKEEEQKDNKNQTVNNEEPVKNQGGPDQPSENAPIKPEENMVVNQTSEENKQPVVNDDKKEENKQVTNENEQPLNGNKVENQEKKEEGKPEEASKEEEQSDESKKKSGDNVPGEGKSEKLVELKKEVKEEVVSQNENQLLKTDDEVIDLDFSGVPEDQKKN